MTFNIGNQTGGNINNVAGDQVIHGGQRGDVVSLPDARRAARELCDAMEHPSALVHARTIDDEMHSRDPDRSRVAGCLASLVRAVRTLGRWAEVGAEVIGRVRLLATWLGRLGLEILDLLPTC